MMLDLVQVPIDYAVSGALRTEGLTGRAVSVASGNTIIAPDEANSSLVDRTRTGH